jgi:hypothetical protein
MSHRLGLFIKFNLSEESFMSITKISRRLCFILICSCLSAATVRAQDAHFAHDNNFSLMTGLSQDLLWDGGNVAVQYVTGRLALEYSHGFDLDLNDGGGLALSSTEKSQGLQMEVPWTTGFGIGYRVTDALHISLEFKAHGFKVTDPESGTQIDYTTFSIGPGVFYDIYIWKGLFIQPALRWWPTVASTLPGGSYTFHESDGTTKVHDVHDWGIFPNASLGWTF